ncbi:protein-export chaperone SecB [Marinivivus vitaminiproducens]|uniref:protein-export chaperone SecB n=1 Tax=Marinivivus vitaminiproducens TaxID=3035935 RepID=UPI0027A7834E|nr:protein-export chaperone SecB [Geminicoccaceae bacterium SCSIO 64248]
MSETAQGGATDPNEAQAQQPRFAVLAQYVKDLSFENPRAPASLQPRESRPSINVRVDVASREFEAERYEVVLTIHVEATTAGETDFVVELAYAGLFAVANVPANAMSAVLMIEAPRLLFPFARRIVADTTRDGGLPPLMIDPIDFVALFRRRIEQQRAQQQQADSAQPPEAGPN